MGAFQDQCKHPGVAQNSTLFDLHTPLAQKANLELRGAGPHAVSAVARCTGWPSSPLSQSPEKTRNLAERGSCFLEEGKDSVHSLGALLV